MHIAEVARRYPDGAVPTALRDITVHIGDVILSLVCRAKLAIRTRNPEAAEDHAVALAEHIAYLAGIGELDETHPSRPLAV